MAESLERILSGSDPAPFTVHNLHGRSSLLIVCDHAGNLVPERLGTLGLSAGERRRHIAWDIGAGAVSRLLGRDLDACVIEQTYSRLVIDCNRPPDADSSIAELSERTAVPGNLGLSQAHRRARRREIFEPYHDRIARELDRRAERGVPAVLVAMHSFTPVFDDVGRPWNVGLLYRDRRLADIVAPLLAAAAGCPVGDNEPYSVSDETDYTIPVHGERRSIPHVGIEIRQDLVETEAGQRQWARLLGEVLAEAERLLLAGWPAR
jgi:predicted N-formylglutamate amidohydrolase